MSLEAGGVLQVIMVLLIVLLGDNLGLLLGGWMVCLLSLGVSLVILITY